MVTVEELGENCSQPSNHYLCTLKTIQANKEIQVLHLQISVGISLGVYQPGRSQVAIGGKKKASCPGMVIAGVRIFKIDLYISYPFILIMT